MSRADVTPPGREAQVRALEKQPGVENPYAVAWASYNESGDCADEAGAVLDPGEHADVIRKRGGSFVLVAKSTGKVLGAHETREGAEAQERAIQARKHADTGARVFRYDTGTLRPAEKTPEGWLRVDGRTARTGVLIYRQGDGTERRELVLPEELFDPDSMRSARMVPVTNQHPAALLDDQTARGHQVGSVGEALRPDGDYLAAPLMITDGETVRAIETGRQQLSWGYDCDITPPDPSLIAKWGEHDGIQRRRRYNHLAVVDEARAGAGARLRLDSDAACMVAYRHSSAVPEPEPEKPMPHAIRIDGLNLDATDANAPAIQQAIDRLIAEGRSRLDAANAAKDKAERERTDATKRADGIKARATAKLKAVRERLDAMKARMMACDECGGEGKVPMADDASKMEKCDYCDGTGKVRMHDAIKAMAPASGEEGAVAEGHPDDDMAAAEEESGEDGLEREPASEENLERAANPEHKDKGKKRADARRVLQQRRADSLARIAARAARERASLLVTAERHLGAEAKLDGKSNLDVKRAVLAKVAPHLDAAKLGASEVEVLYSAEMKRADAAGGGTASDAVRSLTSGARPPGGANPDRDLAEARARRDAANATAWQRKAPAAEAAKK